MARLTDEAAVSLDFVDRDHVLVTFNPKKLVTRPPDCPPYHADRLVHAAILEVPPGKEGISPELPARVLRRYPDASVKNSNLYRNIGTAAMQHGSPQSRQILFALRVVPIGTKAKVDGAKAGMTLLASNTKPGLPATVEMQHYGIDFAVDSSDLRFIPAENDIHHCTLKMAAAQWRVQGLDERS
jgi:hypothetical protein